MQLTNNAMDYNGQRNNEQRLQWIKNAIDKKNLGQRSQWTKITMDKDRMQWTKDTAKNRMHGKMQ